MRKNLCFISLALAGVLLTGLFARLTGGNGVFSSIALLGTWPLALITLAAMIAPKASTAPPKNLLEHTDRTLFAQVLAVCAALTLIVKAALFTL